MSNLAKEIAAWLQTQTLGTVGTDIFVGSQPAAPDACVTVIETSGIAPSGYVPLKKPTVQVLVRSADYATGKTKADAVFDALHQLANIDLGSFYVYYVLATSGMGSIGRDENQRHEWSGNFRLETRAG